MPVTVAVSFGVVNGPMVAIGGSALAIGAPAARTARATVTVTVTAMSNLRLSGTTFVFM